MHFFKKCLVEKNHLKIRSYVLSQGMRIFQGVDNCTEIQVRRENGRRHCTSFGKIKVMIIRPAVRRNGGVI